MKRWLVGLALTVVCSHAYAVGQWCGGKIQRVLTYGDGTVMILPDWRKDWIAVCNISSMRSGVSPTTCAAWFATVKAAAANQAALYTVIFYSDAPACASMPTYNNAPAPGYVSLWG